MPKRDKPDNPNKGQGKKKKRTKVLQFTTDAVLPSIVSPPSEKEAFDNGFSEDFE